MLQERYSELDYAIKMQSDGAIYEEFDIAQLISERVDFLQALYPDFVFQVSTYSEIVFLDKIGFSKVIDNIIENGVKYSQEFKQIDITYKQKILSIKDYGIGMDEVQLVKIFDEYYQVNQTMQGFGIGLSMVKRYCDKNHIELRFDSQKQKGTTVYLELKTKGK
jgi:signal transduction histidine kinase